MASCSSTGSSVQNRSNIKKDSESTLDSIAVKKIVDGNYITNSSSSSNCNNETTTITTISTTASSVIQEPSKNNDFGNTTKSKILDLKTTSKGLDQGFADLVDEVEKPVLISIPETSLSGIDSVLNGIKINESLSDPVLENKDGGKTAVTLTALYELLLVTRQEMEKLRKIQEQMLNVDYIKKYFSSMQNKSESVDDRSTPKSEPLVIDITNGDVSSEDNSKMSSDSSQTSKDGSRKRSAESIKESSEPKFVYKVLTSEISKQPSHNDQSHNSDEMNNPKKRMKMSGNEHSETEKSQAENDDQNDKGGLKNSNSHNSRLRDLLGISNTELDVVPIDESVTLQSVLSAKVPTPVSSASQENTSGYASTSANTGSSNNAESSNKSYTKEYYENGRQHSSESQDSNSFRRSSAEIPNLIPSSQSSARSNSDEYHRDPERLIKLAQTLPNSTLRPKHNIGVVSTSGIMVADQPRMQYPPTRHLKHSLMTVSEPQPLMSHHPVPILSQAQIKYVNERRILPKPLQQQHQLQHQHPHQQQHQHHQQQLLQHSQESSTEGERRLYMQQYINSQRDVDSSGLSTVKNAQTAQTFQPKIIIPQVDKESYSTTDLQGQQNPLHDSGLHSSSSIQSSVPVLPPVSHSFSNIVKRPSAFTSNQNYGYRQNGSNVRISDVVPTGQSINLGPSMHLPSLPPTKPFPHAPPHHSQDQHVGSQPLLQVEKNVQPNVMTVPQHSAVPMTSKLTQNQFHGPHVSMHQKQMSQGPLVYTVPSHSYPPSSHQVHPSYMSQHQHMTAEGSMASYHSEQTRNSSPGRPQIVSPSQHKPKMGNGISPSGYGNAPHYQVIPVSKQISPNQSQSPNRISPHVQSPSAYPSRVQIPPQLSPHHQPPQVRNINPPPPPYRASSPGKSLLASHSKLLMQHQQQQQKHQQDNQSIQYNKGDSPTIQGSSNNSPILSRKHYPGEKQIQMVQVHPNTNGIRESSDYNNPNVASSSPTSTSSRKKCLICPQSAQFLCSGCKTAWYCSKECQVCQKIKELL